MAIKVRVLRGVQAGLTGMSGLVALSGSVAACAADAPQEESVESDDSALSVSNPGTGVFSMAWDYTTAAGFSFTAKNSTDEYVRAGEQMTFAIPSYLLWQRLYPNVAVPNDVVRLQQLTAKVKVVFVKASGATTSTTVATNGTFEGSRTYDLAAVTKQFRVNKKAQSIRFELTIGDAADATQTATVTSSDLNEVAVIGGSLPNKTALFDNYGSAMRQRILERGNPLAGANLEIAYTDWRADTFADSGSIDRTIGNATSYGRFGAFQMPIQGELVHEISYAAAVDGVWQAEQALTPNAKSRLVWGYGRTAYEGMLALPAGSAKLEIYFHVKTFLVVDYDKFSNVGWRKYENGARILVREKWDNENGAYADNYDFAIDAR